MRTPRRNATPAEYSGQLRICQHCRDGFFPKVDKSGRVDLHSYKDRKYCTPCAKIENGLKMMRFNQDPVIKARKFAGSQTLERRMKAVEAMRRRLSDPFQVLQLEARRNSPVAKGLRTLALRRRWEDPEYRRAASERMRRQQQDPNFIEARRNRRKAVYSDERKNALSERGRQRGERLAANPELKAAFSAKVSTAIADRWAKDPEAQAAEFKRRSDRMKARWVQRKIWYQLLLEAAELA